MSTSNKEISKSKIIKIQHGLHLLEGWILKLLDQGVEVLQKDESRIQDIASRLVDCGISSLGRRIRTLPERVEKEPNWKEFVLQELGEYYLICQFAKRKDEILRPDFQQYLGIPIRKVEVEKMNLSAEDQWMYLGHVVVKEENIQIIRSWFIGINSHKIILHIEYLVNRFVRPNYFQYGKTYVGNIFFYPANNQLRATSIPVTQTSIPVGFNLKGETIAEFLLRECKSLINIPWLRYDVVILNSFQLIQQDFNWFIKESESTQALPLIIDEQKVWNLIALSMDVESKLIAEYENGKLKPISIFNRSYILEI